MRVMSLQHKAMTELLYASSMRVGMMESAGLRYSTLQQATTATDHVVQVDVREYPLIMHLPIEQ